jgi:hypothetical protein
MSLVFERYSQVDVGSFFKDSKKQHEWNIVFNDKSAKICVKESFKSKKFRFFFNDKLISENVTQEEEKRKGLDF